jgi:DDE superfamily endonuclease
MLESQESLDPRPACRPAGLRHVHVTEQHTKLDFAYEMKWLVDICLPEAGLIRVVLNNLNTHKIALLYEAFVPAEALRIARKLELHYAPKHGTGLEIAEIQWRVLQQQSLGRYIPE